MKWFARFSVLLALFLATPALAFAGGSVLMWGSYPQLVLGNFFIGLLEAYAIKRRYNTPLNIWLILLANFFSLVIGFVLVAGGITRLFGLDFWGLASESAGEYYGALAIGLVLAFGVSVLVEWPFYYAALYLRKQHVRLPALQVSVFAQLISFAFIVVYMLLMLLIG